MIRYLPLVLKNGFRNRRRSLLTISSIAASMCLLGVLGALYHAFFFSEATPEQALRLVTRNRVSITNIMPISYRHKISQVAGVREVMVSQWFGGVYKEPKNMFARFAAEIDKLLILYPEYKVAEDQKQALLRDRAGCMVGRRLAERYGFKLGDRINLIGDIFPGNWEFTVRAIYDSPTDNENMYFHLENLFQALGVGRDGFAGTFGILIESPDMAARVSAEIDEMFRNSTTQTRTETEQNFILGFLTMMGDVKLILLSICAAVTFTIVLVSANTMAMAARERVREVGILKTLGFSNRAILGMVLGEAAILSAFGGLLGYFIASGLTWMVRQGPAMFPQLESLSVTPPVAAALLSTAVLIGLFASFVPAWNASRVTILESIRYTG